VSAPLRRFEVEPLRRLAVEPLRRLAVGLACRGCCALALVQAASSPAAATSAPTLAGELSGYATLVGGAA
jgi:hypothetical protein